MNTRNRTPSSKFVSYGLYLYFSGLSLRRTAERLTCFIKRNHVSIWNWIQKYSPQKISIKRRKVSRYVMDETLIKVGSEYIWIWWVAIETKTKAILRTKISKERNMFVVERFVVDLIKIHRKHPISLDGGTWYPPQACKFLKLDHHLHFSFEKSIIERTMQYIKDRTESFDDYFPCRIKDCKLKHISNWLNLFVDYHNNELLVKWTEPSRWFVMFK